MKNVLGSYVGLVEGGVNLLPMLESKEKARTDRPKSLENGFSILQLGIVAPEGTEVAINGQTIRIPKAGVFQLSYGLIELESLVFSAPADVNLVYVY